MNRSAQRLDESVQFWKFWNGGFGPGDYLDERKRRWLLDSPDEPQGQDSYWEVVGDEITHPWTTHYVATAKSARNKEDFPACDDHMPIGSERVKELFERVAPGDCAFVPMSIVVDGEPIKEPYYVINCLRMLDCIDRAASAKFGTDLPNEYWRIVVDPKAVPPDVMIFRVLHHPGRLIIRDRLRLAIMEAGLRGCSFDEP